MAKKVSFELKLGITHVGTQHADLELETFTLAGLAKAILTHSASPKFGAYFVRGQAEYRNDASLKDIQLITIDGDSSLNNASSAPDPQKVHTALKKADLNHLIYPSFSNSKEKTRWRVIIPCKGVESKEQLRAATDDITAYLQSENIKINPCRENYVMSQAWYITKPKDDSEYHNWSLLYEAGKQYQIPQTPNTEVQQVIWDHSGTPHVAKTNTQGHARVDSINPEDAIANIKAGVALHPSFISLAGSLINKGFTSDGIYSVLHGLTSDSKANNDRPGRFDNIETELRAILDWIDERQAEEKEDSEIDDFPPIDALSLMEEKPPDREWILEGILTRSAVNVTSGEGGIGKSNLSLLIALACATGHAWPPFEPPAPMKVLMLNVEDPKDEIHRRLWAFKERGLPYDDAEFALLKNNLLIFPARGKVGPLMQLDDRNPVISLYGIWLQETILEQKPDLVFLDTKSRLYGLSENDNDHAAQWISLLEKMAEETGTSFIVMSHTGKAGHDGLYASRGASAISDNARSGLMVSPLSEKEIELYNIEANEYYKLTVTKSNYSALSGQVWYFKKEQEGIPVLIDLEAEFLSGPTGVLLEYLRENEVTKRQIFKGIPELQEKIKPHKVSREKLDTMITLLLKRGDIFEFTIKNDNNRTQKILKVKF